MTKKFIWLGMLAVVLVFGMMVASCGEDDDPLVGTWTDGAGTITLNSDGTLSATMSGMTVPGTWSVNGNILTITVMGQVESDTYIINGNTLIWGGESFTRVG
jgi:uncharacterized protein (UPF0333 family)